MKRLSWLVFETMAMRDTKLETKLRLVALQLENWKKLHDLITYGLDKAKPIISTEQERQFTEIRANLLQEIEYVLRELNILAEVSGKAMSVLQRGVSVRGVRFLFGVWQNLRNATLLLRSATRPEWCNTRSSTLSNAPSIKLPTVWPTTFRLNCAILEFFNRD